MPVLVNKDFDAVIRAVVKTLSHDLRRYFIYKIPKSAVLSACLAFTNAYPNMATITKSFGHVSFCKFKLILIFLYTIFRNILRGKFKIVIGLSENNLKRGVFHHG